MSLNETMSAERVHISFFGMRNAGKSSLVNAILNQDLSVVSEQAGTTTDPVKKSMELLPIGPVLLTDTAGLDDEGELGEKRIEKTLEILRQTDIAVLVVDGMKQKMPEDDRLIRQFKERKLPYITVYTKKDLLFAHPDAGANEIYVSTVTKENIDSLKEMLGRLAETAKKDKPIISHRLKEKDTVILVVPIDKAAPRGRLIMPQQMVIRDLLDGGMMPFVCRDTELKDTMEKLKEPPAMVITDSQVFAKVAKVVPKSIPLTSFSILMASYKGVLKQSLEGAAMLDEIVANDRILISEGCTHHRQCGDIGTEKLPRMIRDYTGTEPEFFFTSGGSFVKEEELTKYRLVIHCGGCMLNEKEMTARMETAKKAKVPFTNYGIAMAKMNGILERMVLDE
ncbi:MAG: [FeFe] hydrogenase H-cluster maturation GTPase HydF [Lachnospiraceae bacterium]|nr:[FeFe] hydrogenase H-cluster maturation GTPase HydF [Lachnospiraceae bacterium]